MTSPNFENTTAAYPLTCPEETARARSAFVSNALFAEVAPAVLDKICQQVEVIAVPANGIVFDEDELGDSLYLITRGEIRISKRGRDGQQETLAVLQTNDYFGDMALVDNEKRSARASAVEETVLGRVDRETWDLLLRFAPHEVMANFTRSMMHRLRQNNQHLIQQLKAVASAA